MLGCAVVALNLFWMCTHVIGGNKSLLTLHNDRKTEVWGQCQFLFITFIILLFFYLYVFSHISIYLSQAYWYLNRSYRTV